MSIEAQKLQLSSQEPTKYPTIILRAITDLNISMKCPELRNPTMYQCFDVHAEFRGDHILWKISLPEQSEIKIVDL